MKNVFIVYYDNGGLYPEDHEVHVHKMFASRESAEACVKEKSTLKMFKCSVPPDEWTQDDIESTGYTYQEFYDMEYHDWCQSAEERYFMVEKEVHP